MPQRRSPGLHPLQLPCFSLPTSQCLVLFGLLASRAPRVRRRPLPCRHGVPRRMNEEDTGSQECLSLSLSSCLKRCRAYSLSFNPLHRNFVPRSPSSPVLLRRHSSIHFDITESRNPGDGTTVSPHHLHLDLGPHTFASARSVEVRLAYSMDGG